MKKRIKVTKLSQKAEARKSLVKNLAKSLILSGKIKTTKAKAKFAKNYIESLVVLAKANGLAKKRKIFAKLGKKTGEKLISEISPKFTKVNSGFTRIINLGQRLGDGAPTALLEFAYPSAEAAKETKKTKETQATEETKTQATQDSEKTKGAKNVKEKSQ